MRYLFSYGYIGEVLAACEGCSFGISSLIEGFNTGAAEGILTYFKGVITIGNNHFLEVFATLECAFADFGYGAGHGYGGNFGVAFEGVGINLGNGIGLAVDGNLIGDYDVALELVGSAGDSHNVVA